MPIIPQGQENVRLNPSSPVPIASTTDARITGEAIARFGAGVEQFGGKLLEVQRDINKNEGRAKINSIYQTGFDRAKREAQPDGSDLNKLVAKYTEQPVADAINETSSWDWNVRRDLEGYKTRVDSDIRTQTVITGAEMLEKDNYRRLDLASDTAADRVREQPNENLIGAEFRNYNALIDKQVTEGRMSAPVATKLKSDAQKKIAVQYIDGLSNIGADAKALAFLRANQEDPDLVNELTPQLAQDMGLIDSREAAALAEKGEKYKVPVMTKGDKVRLTPELTALNQAIDPETKSRMIDKLSRKAKEKSELRMADLNAQLNGFEAVALSGQPIDEANLPDLIRQIDSFPSLPPVAKSRLKDKVYTAMAINRRLQDVAATPRSNYQDFLSKAQGEIGQADAFTRGKNPDGSPVMDYAIDANRMKALETVEASMASIIKEQNEDAAQYVLDHDPGNQMKSLEFGTRDGDSKGTATYINASLAKQRYLEIPADKQRVLPKAEALRIGQTLAAQPDSENVNEYLGQLEKQYGHYYPRVMKEVSSYNKKAEAYATAAFAPIETRTALVDALKNEEAINKAFSDRGFSETKSALVDEAIRKTTLGDLNRVYSTTSGDASGVATVNNLQRAITLQVKSALLQDPDAKIPDLVKKSYDDLVGSQYAVVKTDNSTLMVPKRAGGVVTNPEFVKGFVEVYSRGENFSKLNVAVPKGWEADRYYATLEVDGQWIMNSTGTGMRLIRVDAETGKRANVLDKYGHIVEKSFAQISQSPGKDVLDHNKGFLGRMFEGINNAVNGTAEAK